MKAQRGSSSTLSEPRRHALATLPPVSIVRETGWAPGTVCTNAENRQSLIPRTCSTPSSCEPLLHPSLPHPSSFTSHACFRFTWNSSGFWRGLPSLTDFWNLCFGWDGIIARSMSLFGAVVSSNVLYVWVGYWHTATSSFSWYNILYRLLNWSKGRSVE